MQVQTSQGVKDVSAIGVTPENYIVPKGEEHLYHAVIEVKKFDSNTGKRQSVPRVQKFGKKTFESGGVRDNLGRQGYSILILHNPNEWVKQNEKRLADQQAENNQKAIELKAKKDEEKRAKANEEQQKRIDDAVAEALKKQAEDNQKRIDEAVAKALKANKPKAEKVEKTDEKAEKPGK